MADEQPVNIVLITRICTVSKRSDFAVTLLAVDQYKVLTYILLMRSSPSMYSLTICIVTIRLKACV